MNILEALKAVSTSLGDNDENEGDDETISELALAAIRSMTQNSETAVDLHSAVYMFHFVQALIKLTTSKNAYEIHVGTIWNS